jgi:hypothetical protein
MRERATNLWLSGEMELTGKKLDLDEIARLLDFVLPDQGTGSTRARQRLVWKLVINPAGSFKLLRKINEE